MTGKSKKTYEVGYKKPPVATRFKKGQSPNPGGRPKKVRALRDPGAILEAVDNEEIIVTDNGKRKRMKKAEIQFRISFTRATKGDLPTARLLVDMATKYFAPEERENLQAELIGAAEAAQRFGRNWPDRIRQHNALLIGE